jgi:hypothetical protein
MANEASIRSSLQIRKGNLNYQGQPTAFLGNVTGTKGPLPGAVSVPPGGINVDLSGLTKPGYCRLQNLDAVATVDYGIWDATSSTFFPVGEIQPGETYIIRFSRHLMEEYFGTGTGVLDPSDRFRLRSSVGTVVVVVEAFEA